MIKIYKNVLAIVTAILFAGIFNQALAQDVGVSAITSPVNNCGAGAQTVSITISNNGAGVVVGNIPVSYQLDGTGATVNETCPSGNLAPGATIIYTFTAQITIPQGTTAHSIVACSALGLDLNSANNCFTKANIFNYAIIGNNTISTNQNICQGSSPGVFTGTPPSGGNNSYTYQWEISTTSATAGYGDISGATSSTYTSPALSQTTWFRRKVNSVGVCTVHTSNAIQITVSPTSIGGSTSTNPTTVCAGSNGSINLSGQTGNITKWQSSTNGGTSYADIANTSTSLPYNNITTTTIFRAVVQSGVCPTANSNPTTIIVDPTTVGGNVKNDTTVCNGTNTGTVKLSGQVGAISNWEQSTNNGVSWLTISNTTTSQAYTNLNTTTLYRAVLKSGTCTSANSAPATITVSPTSVGGSISAPVTTVCSGTNNGTLTLSGHTGLVVQWESSTNGGSTWTIVNNTTATLNFNNLVSTTVFRAFVKSGACGGIYSSTITINVDATSTGGNTAGAKAECSGSNSGTITVSGQSGTILRWEYSTDGGSSWNNISNTTASQPYNNLTLTTDYRVISQGGVCTSAQSSVSTITISPVSVGGTIATSTAVCSGLNGATLTLSGQTGTIQNWESSTDGGATWNLLANTTTTQAYSNLTVSTQYRATIQSGVCPVTKSAVATITVDPVSVGGTIAGNTAVCYNSNGNSLTLSGYTGSIANWESSTDGGASWTTIVNTTNTQNYFNLTQTTIYRAQVKSGSCSAIASGSATITVDPTTVGGTLAGSMAVCSGSNAGTLILSGEVGNIQNWESSTDGGVTWLLVPNTTHSLAYTNITANTLYRALVKSGSCTQMNSSIASITVNPQSVGGNISGAVIVCATANSGTLTLSGQTGAILNWESSQDGGSSWSSIANTTTTLNFTNLTTTTIYRAVVQSGNCPSTTSNPATITVDPTTVGGSIAGSGSVCGGNNSGSLTLNGNVGNVQQWEFSTDNGSTWNILANTTTSQSYNNINPPDRIYRALVKSGLCTSAYSNTATITITSSVVAGKVVNDALVCRGVNNGVLTLVGQAGNIVRWESSIDGTTWTPIANTTTSQSYLNITNTTQYRVAILDCGGGTSFSAPATVVVDPSPSAVGGNVLGSTTVCSGTNSGSLTLNGQNGTVSSWELSTNGGVSWSAINNTTTTQNYSNVVVSTQYRALVKSGVCSSVPASPATIGVNPASVGGTVSGTAAVCSGSNSGTLKLSGHTGTVLNWEFSTDGGTTWSTIANTTTSQTYTNVSTTTLYHAIVQSGVCAPATSSDATISITPASVGGSILGSITVCAGTNSGSLILSGIVGNVTRWEYSIDNGGTWITISNTTTTQNFLNLSTTTQYRAIVKSGVCSADISTIATVSTDAVPLGGVTSGTATVCANMNSGIITLSGYSGNIVNWESSSDGGVTWTSISNSTFTQSYSNLGVTTDFRAVIGNGTCTNAYSLPTTITVIKGSAGGIINGTANVCSGSNSGSVVVSSYTGNIVRWESSTDGGTTWVSLGNTTNTQSYLNLTLTTIYRAVVQNSICTVAYSGIATISVKTVDTQGEILSDAIVCPGNNSGTLTVIGYVTTVGGTLLYWESSTDGGITWSNIANTTDTLSYRNITQTTRYRAFTQGCGLPLASKIATILVDNSPAAVGGAVIGNNAYCSPVNSGTLNLTGQTGTVVNWESSTDAGLSWSTITNTTPTLNYTNLTKTTSFRAVVKSGVCSAIASSPATIIVSAETVAGTVTGAKNECISGNSGVLTLKNYVGSITQWETSTDGGTNWNPVANNTDTISYKDLTATTIYRATVKNNFCSTLTASATINVAPLTVGGTVNGSTSVCPGVNAGALTLTGETGTNGGWQVSTDGGNTWLTTSNQTNTQNYSNLAITTDYRVTMQSGACPPSASTTGTITVNSSVVGGSVSGAGTAVCAGNNKGKLTLNGFSGTIIRWESSVDGGTTWVPISNTTDSLKFTNITTTTQYKAIVQQSGACNNMTTSTIATVDVNPTPVPAFSSPMPYAGEALLFTNNTQIATGGIRDYSWNFGDNTDLSTDPNPTHTFALANSFVVTLTATSDQGCVASANKSLSVTIDDGFKFIIPNLMTLNDNGLNDTWSIENLENYESEATIYDGYGTIVFQASPYLNNWDGTYKGKKLADGTYFYILKIKSIDKIFKGTINIVK